MTDARYALYLAACVIFGALLLGSGIVIGRLSEPTPDPEVYVLTTTSTTAP